MNLEECYKILGKFLDFLKGRTSFQNKDELQNSYEDFKRWLGGAPPDFPFFFDRLKLFNMINITGDQIDFTPLNEQPAAKDNICRELQKNWPYSVADKNDIIITSKPPLEDQKPLRLENDLKHSITFKVENIGAEPVKLTRYFLLKEARHFTLENEHEVTQQNPLLLQPGASCEIRLNFQSRNVCFSSAKVAFQFTADLQASDTPFYITRRVGVLCVTSLGRELGPVAPHNPLPRRGHLSMALFQSPWKQKIRRPQRSSWNRQGPRVPLDTFRMTTKRLISLKPISGEVKKRLESPLQWNNYTEKLQLLLHLAHLQLDEETKHYNIPNGERQYATMKKNGEFLVLEMPGLYENCQCVRPGNKLFVYPVKEWKGFIGFIESVQQESLMLRFGPELLAHFEEDMKFRVEFVVNTLLLRIQHRAANLAVERGLQKLLFPDKAPPSRKTRRLTKLELFDKQLEQNPAQYKAIRDIISGTSMPAPYLVFGPPGTGKTVTLVEAIKQIQKIKKSCHILACAPTNSAADLLCRKILCPEDKRNVFRLYALTFNPNSVHDDLKNCCNLRGESFYLPDTQKLMSYKIIVTTLHTASRLVTEGIDEGHFTHVFVDEAGQAAESECLIPLAGLVKAGRGQVVLAGDPKQLGPIIRCPSAKKYGLNVSLLERLLIAFSDNKSVDGAFDSRFVTKLLRNYRSHPDILKVPNDLFYGGQLEAFADESRNSCCDWEGLRQQGFPVIFCGVRGLDEREASSPSFFNITEVDILTDYVKKLLQTSDSQKVKPEDIGIITPYRKQVTKIQEALSKKLNSDDINGIKVGPVEEFQGDERRVILLSTVRSNTEFLQSDKVSQMGFVTNEKRFNVALTRAKALLIVVGNPDTLETNDSWKTFIDFCKKNGGYFCPEDLEGEREE